MNQICVRCVMDTTDPEIKFDERGVCNHCRKADWYFKHSVVGQPIEIRQKMLCDIIKKIKKEGNRKKYDCIIGVSGGVDSTYTAYMVQRSGLRPLAVHVDNGWNSELAVRNIEYTLKHLGIELDTQVLNWQEFKNLQLAFLKASTPDSEIPTDHAIGTVLLRTALREGVRYIIGGTNAATESILPRAWSQGHGDWRYIQNTHKEFSQVPLKTFPHRGLLQSFFYKYVCGIEWINFLDYFDYVKADAIKLLEEKIQWKNYSAKHFESVYTRFYQSHILPVKFGFDKRKAHFSSMIVSGQMDRESALNALKKPICDAELIEQDKEFVINKFGLTEKEFQDIIDLPPKKFENYKSYHSTWYFKLFQLMSKCKARY